MAKQFNFRCSDEQMQQYQDFAKKNGLTLAEIIKKGIEMYIQEFSKHVYTPEFKNKEITEKQDIAKESDVYTPKKSQTTDRLAIARQALADAEAKANPDETDEPTEYEPSKQRMYKMEQIIEAAQNSEYNKTQKLAQLDRFLQQKLITKEELNWLKTRI